MVTRLVLFLLRWAFVPSRPVVRTSPRGEGGSVFVANRAERARVTIRHHGAASRIAAPLAVAFRSFIAPLWMALIAGVAVGAVLYARAVTSWTADSDPALHLRMIKDVAATGRLPTELPFLAARVGEGGAIEQTFPYGYTPLYHIVGATFYLASGVNGIFLMNALAAAVITFVVYRMTCRRVPSMIALLSACAVWLPPSMHRPFTNVFMEPLMLAFIAAAGWFAYSAVATRSVRTALVAGMFMGLAISTRQNALLYAGVIHLVVLWQVVARQGWRRARWSRELPWLACMVAGVAVAATPGLLYLMHVTGGIGYGDITIPGTGHPIPIDPVANQYLSDISKPDSSPWVWFDRYASMLFYATAWLPDWTALIPALLSALGCRFLYVRGGPARFLSRWIVLQVLIEIALMLTLHANARYVMFSQGMVYAAVPVGAYAAVQGVARASRRLDVTVASGGAIALLGACSLLPIRAWDAYAYADDANLRQFRAQSYAEAGAWVNENTPPNALFLVPRTYTAELTWSRTVTWVTYYGNAWVIDAIRSADPKEAHRILADHGVDYVVIQAPPGTYVDRMPADGMRSYLHLGAPAPRYFSLVFQTRHSVTRLNGKETASGVRIYRVNPLRENSR